MSFAGYRRLALILLVATMVRAEENCGRMERFATPIRGIVRSAEPLKVEVTELQEDNLALRKGATVVVPVPAKTFTEGKTYDLQAVWLACDGAFRRFEELVLARTRTVEPYGDAWLEVGHVYRATAAGRQLVPHPAMPHHHIGSLSWTNAEAFLPEDDVERRVTFEVVSQSIEYRRERTWVQVLSATIREVQ